jgi:hypothetical protein
VTVCVRLEVTLVAPSNGRTANQILQCASKVANQFSIAGVLGTNEETHPVGAAVSNAFLGNTFSGISDTITHVATGHFGAAYADFALGGTAQGLPYRDGSCRQRNCRRDHRGRTRGRRRRRDGYACWMGEAQYRCSGIRRCSTLLQKPLTGSADV